MEINLRDYYVAGAILSTPDKLLDAETVAKRLPEGMAKARWPKNLVEIRQAELTWMPVRAEKGKDMVMIPVWVLTYTANGDEYQDTAGWVAFSAVDGKLVAAIFN